MSNPRTLHVNVYKGGYLAAHWTREFADAAALTIGVEREACVEAAFHDGDGLGLPASPDDEARSLIRNSIETLVRKMAPWAREEADRMLLAMGMGVAPGPAEGHVASPEARGAPVGRRVYPTAGMTADVFAELLAESRARFDALTPAQQEAELRLQQESYVRGEMGMRDADSRRTGRPRNNDHEDDCA